MPNIIMPREKWDPLYRKEKELRKKKALETGKVGRDAKRRRIKDTFFSSLY